MSAKRQAVAKLAERLRALRPEGSSAPNASEWPAYVATLREALHLYEDAVRTSVAKGQAGSDLDLLRTLAARAFNELGGQAEPCPRSLSEYDHERFGPYLGVSGEGPASKAIREAALASPKVVALGLTDPIEVGVAHDAERLGSVGELPVGLDEYREIRLEAMGRILTSTNIGSRLNVRFYGRVREVWVNPGPRERLVGTALESARERFAPFVNTPDGRPRPLVVYVAFRAAVPAADRRAVLARLAEAARRGEIGSPRHHFIGLLARVGRGERGVQAAVEALQLARAAGVKHVAIQGVARAASVDVVSMPGLLQYFNPAQTRRLIDAAHANGVRIRPKNVVDTASVARQAWAGLTVARAMGLELGKYGLFPLTLEESGRVVRLVQGWFDGWTATPAFYVDVPLVTENRVFSLEQAPQAARAWLRMAARQGAAVVLIDTVEKSKGRRLLKGGPADRKGIFTIRDVKELDRYARRRGIRILWAGGITLPQAYEFGRMAVFGVYVTSAVASARAVGPEREADPALAVERLPTTEGVATVKLLLEAGFLVTQLARHGLRKDSRRIDLLAQPLLEKSARGWTPQSPDELWSVVAQGWRTLADTSRS